MDNSVPFKNKTMKAGNLQAIGVLQRVILLAFTLMGSLLMVAGVVDAKPTVSGLRLGPNGDTTRLVIDVDEEISYSHLVLANPSRIVIDLPEVDFDLPTSGAGAGKGAVERFRYGLFRAGVSRVVLDLKDKVLVDRAFVLPPQGGNKYRVVFDLKKVTDGAFSAAVGQRQQTTASPTPQRAPIRAVGTSRPARDKRLIVVDAGHGGVDPGNLGVIGVPEKTIVLELSREIKRVLEATGRYDVVLTRNRDIYLRHRDRFEVARDQEADLFISVHADSIDNRKVRGATVYTLSERASDAESARLARKENRSDLIAGIDLSGESDEVTSILVDLAQRETMNYSSRFAEIFVDEMENKVLLRSNPHRFASLLVLKAPDVPSILLEAGYLTNRADAKIMNSSEGRRQMATALRGALDRYFQVLAADGF